MKSVRSRYLKTSDIAKSVGVHANTVRLYEARGLLSPVPRSKTGYRLFTNLHLEQMRLAHLALQWPYAGSNQVVLDLVKCAADGDLGMAMEQAYQYLASVRMERTRAEAAVEYLEWWARAHALDKMKHTLSISQAAAHLGVTIDQLRNWDRNGLLDVPRHPDTGYRLYGASEIGRLRVIRMLRQSGYSLMAILRMLKRFDAGETERLREVLDTPGENEDIETVADRWLTTLAEQEKRAQAIIRQIAAMMALAQ
jgi:DNA-binding transcriptional MerR regulator